MFAPEISSSKQISAWPDKRVKTYLFYHTRA